MRRTSNESTKVQNGGGQEETDNEARALRVLSRTMKELILPLSHKEPTLLCNVLMNNSNFIGEIMSAIFRVC